MNEQERADSIRGYDRPQETTAAPAREIPEQIAQLSSNVQLIIEQTKVLNDRLACILPHEDSEGSAVENVGRPATFTTYGSQLEEQNYRLGIVSTALQTLIAKAQV